MTLLKRITGKLKACFLFVLLQAACTTLCAQDYDVTNFGAKGDNSFDNTKAIQKAIDKAAVKGGTVIIPSGGIYLSGTLQLKNNVTLRVNKNATLKGIAQSEAYPPQPITYPLLPNSGLFGNTLIYANDAENISIEGEGTIDGNGGDTVFHFVEGQTEHVRRPYVLLIVKCRYVRVSDITLKNSAMWMQRYIACDFLRLKGITVFNHVNPNNDGVDIEDCSDVLISDCIIDADDDALCFKSEGNRGVNNVVVTNCILSSHASAFKFGTGSVGGFQSIQFSNSIIRPSRATSLVHIFKQKGGLTGIDMASTDGALLKDINIQNISIDSVQNPIFIRLGNRLKSKLKDRAGLVEGIHFSQITVTNAGPTASAVAAFPGTCIKDVSFRDIFIEHNGTGNAGDTSLVVPENANIYPGYKMYGKRLPATGFYVRHVKNIQFNNIQVKLLGNDLRPALVCDDVDELEISGLKYRSEAGAVPGLLVIANSKNGVVNCLPGDEKQIRQVNNTKISVQQ